ncbi:terminase large subunit domain-containing protein [Streptacidiphilus sp. N1-12]|uniref:Terminase large subunit domain-containing protein n=2 Tax=Streptacidiphilus alkalitolerans TaxID=3342712 RepID=A0ABV6WEJ9_9ACTN
MPRRRAAPPRFPRRLPRGPQLWDREKSRWSEENTDGVFACELIESYLRLTKGPARGTLVQLREWQADLICDILRLDAKGRRQYWTYLLLVPRKNSKSLLGAGLAIDGLFDEQGAEVYSCAAAKDQAKIIFGEVRAAVEMAPELDAKQGGLLKVYRDAIEYPATGSVYRALSSEAFTKEGLNPSRVLFDELHAQPNWELWNVMNQGSDTRQQPLVIGISTFGVKSDASGQDSVCYAQYQYAKKIIKGELEDLRYGARIYETNDRVRGFDYRDQQVWERANPSLGDFLDAEKMAAAMRKTPEGDFKTKRLNIWVSKATVWLPEGAWDRCAAPDTAIPDGVDVVLGFDGSYNNDCTGLTVVRIPETLRFDPDAAEYASLEDDQKQRLFKVRNAGLRLPHLDVVQLWERPADAGQDWTVPILEAEEAIREACRRWQVREIVVDPARWARTFQILDSEGLPVMAFPQSPERMVPATGRFYEGVMNQRFTHSGDPRLARHIGNAVTKPTTRGPMVFKDSKSSPRKIDLAVASIIALHVACSPPEGPPEPQFFSWDDL